MRLPLLVACLVACALSGCSGPPAGGDGRVEAVPTAEPSGAGRERLLALRATVIDSGSGPELCVGPIQLSSPPGCTGIPLVGWTWPADSEKQAGVRWGGYSVVGTFDGERFHAEKVIDEAEAATYDVQDAGPDFRTRCPEPAGGWRAPEPDRATADDMDRLFEAAKSLPGYATAWMDDQGHVDQDPLHVVVNVQVTGDIEQATRILRRSWGGSLCVSRATHAEAELIRISDAMMKLPHALGCSFGVDFLDCETVYDDGTLQRQVDARYGRGVVQVSSALQRYPG